MKPININITEARLKGIAIEFMDGDYNSDNFHVSATIELLSPVGKRITTYSIDTRWNSEADKLFKRWNIAIPVGIIANEIENLVLTMCNKEMGLLNE